MNGEMGFVIPESVKVPRESHKFMPKNELIYTGEGKKIQRHVFKDAKLTDFENKKLIRLEEEVKKLSLEIPENWDRNELLRFCYGTGWKTRKAIKGLIDHLKWRKTTFPKGYIFLYPEITDLMVKDI